MRGEGDNRAETACFARTPPFNGPRLFTWCFPTVSSQVFNEQVPRHELGEGNAGLVVIRNGSVRVHWLRGKDNHWRFACIKSAVESARSLKFPDTAFIVNIDDFPICKEKRCPLPVFTNYKKWRGGKNLETNEVLFPVSFAP